MNGSNRRHFTGHERDLENGMDYMLARYYSSSLGRFMAVDPGDDTDPEKPQSWNKYAYVRNNPLKNVDPKGTNARSSNADLQRHARNQANQMAKAEMNKKTQEAAAKQEAAKKAETVKKVGDAAETVGTVADFATVGLLAASAVPVLAPATLPAAGTTAAVGAGADAVAFAADPTSPERAAALGANILGGVAGAGTSVLLKQGAPALEKSVTKAVGLATSQAFDSAANLADPAALDPMKIVTSP